VNDICTRHCDNEPEPHHLQCPQGYADGISVGGARRLFVFNEANVRRAISGYAAYFKYCVRAGHLVNAPPASPLCISFDLEGPTARSRPSPSCVDYITSIGVLHDGLYLCALHPSRSRSSNCRAQLFSRIPIIPHRKYRLRRKSGLPSTPPSAIRVRDRLLSMDRSNGDAPGCSLSRSMAVPRAPPSIFCYGWTPSTAKMRKSAYLLPTFSWMSRPPPSHQAFTASTLANWRMPTRLGSGAPDRLMVLS